MQWLLDTLGLPATPGLVYTMILASFLGTFGAMLVWSYLFRPRAD